ncbi:uncharacterized protein TNCT_642631 [Trichonephila clavata]|uniref:Uncharacterized protein n=1 Tax=Trichonephila clavata TaxID=2740835 RepID=A0A8X6LU54_TRICU|nr:uncharacterized protein TNCT_642631 [Trichonephila clavata]
MSSIKTLNRKRGSILAQLTKLSSKPLDNLSEFELRVVLDSLNDIKERFEDIKQVYFEIDNDDEFKDVEPILNKIDEAIQDFQVCGKLLLYKCTEVNKFKDNNSSEHSNNVRLPEIPLPQFDGQFGNWSSFKNQFHNLIENNSKLSDYQKLFYLIASLKGVAKQLQSPNNTYDSLLKALTLRYENTKLIVDSHIQNIINYKPILKENPAELRLLTYTLQRNIRSLEALKFENGENLAKTIKEILCKSHKEMDPLCQQGVQAGGNDTFIWKAVYVNGNGTPSMCNIVSRLLMLFAHYMLDNHGLFVNLQHLIADLIF